MPINMGIAAQCFIGQEPWHSGRDRWSRRLGLLLGLALARCALALSFAQPSRFEVRLRFRELGARPRPEGVASSLRAAGRRLWGWKEGEPERECEQVVLLDELLGRVGERGGPERADSLLVEFARTRRGHHHDLDELALGRQAEPTPPPI